MVVFKVFLKNFKILYKITLKIIYWVRDLLINYFIDLNKLFFSVFCYLVFKINNIIKDLLSFNIFII